MRGNRGILQRNGAVREERECFLGGAKWMLGAESSFPL
jgi:hypothetical protein